MLKAAAWGIALAAGITCSAMAVSREAVDYTALFAVNLDEPLPGLDELKQRYGKNTIYDRRYEFSWNIGQKFDEVFAQTILAYGGSDKRLKNTAEDELVAMIEALPPETYPYIGPYLHTIPDMSPKILNMPGIKETKNKFPERIAPEAQGIKNLEFLSPYLYYLLMPEIWPSYAYRAENVEPKPQPKAPKLVYNQGFFDMVRAMVPPEEFYPNSGEAKVSWKQSLRTPNPSLSSNLTTADVEAFVETLPEVEKYAAQKGKTEELIVAGMLVNAYENEQGKALPVNSLKDMVNPCQRLAQRIRLIGDENEFMQIVGKQGMKLDEWAYTCDRVIKAYRVSNMSASDVTAVLNYKQGVYISSVTDLPEYLRAGQLAAMYAVVAMYSAPLSDVAAVRPLRKALDEAWRRADYSLAGMPVVRKL